MPKGVKKGKKDEFQTVSLGEYFELEGLDYVPCFKEISTVSTASEGSSTKVIDLASLPSAPKSSYEVVILPEITKRGPPFCLTVKNIPFDVYEEEIKAFFEGLDVSSVEVLMEGGRSHRCALVYFSNMQDFKSALEKDGTKMGSRGVEIQQEPRPEEFTEKGLRSFGTSMRGRSDIKGSRIGTSRYNYDSQDTEPTFEADKSTNWRSNENRPTHLKDFTTEDNRNVTITRGPPPLPPVADVEIVRGSALVADPCVGPWRSTNKPTSSFFTDDTAGSGRRGRDMFRSSHAAVSGNQVGIDDSQNWRSSNSGSASVTRIMRRPKDSKDQDNSSVHRSTSPEFSRCKSKVATAPAGSDDQNTNLVSSVKKPRRIEQQQRQHRGEPQQSNSHGQNTTETPKAAAGP